MWIKELKSIGFALAVAGSIFPEKAFAHGEDKPGPHGGEIRMPGGFHTEVLSEKDGFRVYLLDIQFANPVVTGSAVEAGVRSRGKTTPLICKAETSSFFCASAKGAEKTRGAELIVKAKRENAQGNNVIYKLPLLRAAAKTAEPKKTTESPSAKPAGNPHQGHGHDH